ncbi:hypothetical protein SAMN05660462_02881 [Proteiniborus ethanoligenes]|uniref:Uncharacterized protein n=1 Tax=Proteiniborus ethanoligenes TaxID=415015 RepID=A0A1H3SGR9_9FIRM|nr:hypothetical protein [Proteiniborus ethanoligenes]SDZ36870.1 hypothetical protein SAMN05660462_02881 [Proteiniborus ethanoligenes]
MKKILWAFVGTILIFFFSLIAITPLIMNIGYSSVEGSYHAVTHAILLSLIFIVIVCTIMILEEINKIKK